MASKFDRQIGAQLKYFFIVHYMQSPRRFNFIIYEAPTALLNVIILSNFLLHIALTRRVFFGPTPTPTLRVSGAAVKDPAFQQTEKRTPGGRVRRRTSPPLVTSSTRHQSPLQTQELTFICKLHGALLQNIHFLFQFTPTPPTPTPLNNFVFVVACQCTSPLTDSAILGSILFEFSRACWDGIVFSVLTYPFSFPSWLLMH